MNLLSAALQFLLLFEKSDERFARIGIAQSAVVHQIVVDHPRMDRDAPIEASVDHLPHLIERLFERTPLTFSLIFESLNQSSLCRIDCIDLRVLAIGVIRSTEICNWSRPAPSRSVNSSRLSEKPVRGHAHTAKAEGFCVTDQLDNIRDA